MIQLDALAWLALLAIWALCDFRLPETIGWFAIMLCLLGSVGEGNFILRSCAVRVRSVHGWLAPKMPKGLIRIMAPLAWLSGFGAPLRPAEMVMPQSKGSESSQN